MSDKNSNIERVGLARALLRWLYFPKLRKDLANYQTYKAKVAYITGEQWDNKGLSNLMKITGLNAELLIRMLYNVK